MKLRCPRHMTALLYDYETFGHRSRNRKYRSQDSIKQPKVNSSRKYAEVIQR